MYKTKTNKQKKYPKKPQSKKSFLKIKKKKKKKKKKRVYIYIVCVYMHNYTRIHTHACVNMHITFM